MPSNDPLLQPLTIRHLTLKNRVMSTSHAISYGEDAKPRERYQLYHEEKAKGGIGLTMFGGSSNVSTDSGSVFGQLYVGNDDIVPHFREFADRIHRHGTALMCQITHLGGRSHWRADNWLPTVAPSRYREPSHRGFTKEIDRHDIRRIVTEFGDAARRCREGGLDGVEVHVHGHLIGQFWSPLVNRRSDEFGGSLDNRCRFGLMVLEEIRRRVGDDFLVGIRMAVGEGREDGLRDEDYAEIARLHDRSGLIDFFNLTYGRIDTEVGLAHYMPGMHVGLSPQLAAVAAFNQNLTRPVFHAARINDLATARYAIQNGIVDLVGMTRAHIADPHIVEKIERGEEERIRPCVGATYCSWQRRCIHNPSIGNERTLPHRIVPAAARRRVVIVGAGPGGLEAARVCAERGHEVILFEAASKAGGQVLLASRMPLRRDLIGIVDWRLAEAERLGVTFRYNTYADAATVAAQEPDVVIIATGGVPDRMEDEIPGAALAQTVWDLLEAPKAAQGTILFYDGTGNITGAAAAEMLARQGASLVYVTPDHFVAQEASYLDRPFIMRELYKAGTPMHPDRRLRRIARSGNRLEAIFVNEYSDAEEAIVCDTIIVEAGTIPMDELYLDMRSASRNEGVTDIDAFIAGRRQNLPLNPEGRYEVHRIGDAVSSRDIHAAILDALRLCQNL
ncbi:oxidoreductase [Labrys monachus]|uniref:2,4-dienoyl-CoA reductase-like NADH-dependent reductase (Old Yellow Enzyme family) n=1 Tax=Labrys monachus TaxID=217067 RepID=A0ABU0F769_9HYPH|nr:FAD-dependent oxidoreductase [Labrys monachus]MDQ0390462.1 2,4-dienoyl-CoA reductase-like NADH-dependent reductase (Old Yellow Enzyme family) [Labrys monachus]